MRDKMRCGVISEKAGKWGSEGKSEGKSEEKGESEESRGCRGNWEWRE